MSFIKLAPYVLWTGYFDSPESELTLKTFPYVKQAMQCNMDICARTFTKPHFANFKPSPFRGPQTALKLGPAPISTYGRVMLDLVPAGTSSSHIPATNATAFQINYCDHDDLMGYLSELLISSTSAPGQRDDGRGRVQRRLGPQPVRGLTPAL